MTPLRIIVSRHSAFYSPLISTLSGGFLKEEGLEATYDVLKPGQRSHVLIREGAVDIMQSAVGSNFSAMEKGESDLPVHFAQINRLDGFFLVGRSRRAFHWKDLEGRKLLADHGLQPLLMLRYAAHCKGVNWSRVEVLDAGTPEAMEAAFREGRGDYVHLQGPAPQQLEYSGAGHVAASVGEAMPPVAFSSLLASRAFLEQEEARAFLRAYRKARLWANTAAPAKVAEQESAFFPGVDRMALTSAIARYQTLGCWSGDIGIPRDLYEQALEVFLHGGVITRRHPYEEVVVAIH